MQTILVVDDDFAMRRGIALTLRGEGYTVFEAEDATKTLQLLNENTIDWICFWQDETGIR